MGDVVELSCSTAEEAALWVTAVRQLMAEMEEVAVQARVTRELMQYDAAAAVKATMANVAAATNGAAVPAAAGAVNGGAGAHLRNRNMASISPVSTVTPDTLKAASVPPLPPAAGSNTDAGLHTLGGAEIDAPADMRGSLPASAAWSETGTNSITPVTTASHADASMPSSPARLPPMGAVVHIVEAVSPTAAGNSTPRGAPPPPPPPPSQSVLTSAPTIATTNAGATLSSGSSDAIGLIDDASTRCLPLSSAFPVPAPPPVPRTAQPPPPPPVLNVPSPGSAPPSQNSARLPA
ncbi:hypothetical protein EON68_02415, partial [archaeon]